MKQAPKSFPSQSEIKEISTGEDLDHDQMNSAAALIEQLLLRCCSPITWPEGRKRIVANKDLDILEEDEITIEELDQLDANHIVSVASKISHIGKEAGETSGNFLGESILDNEFTPDSENVCVPAE